MLTGDLNAWIYQAFAGIRPDRSARALSTEYLDHNGDSLFLTIHAVMLSHKLSDHFWPKA